MKVPYDINVGYTVIVEEYAKKGHVLTGIQNIIEGNFVIFDEDILPPKTPEEKITELEETNEALLNHVLEVDLRLIMMELGGM